MLAGVPFSVGVASLILKEKRDCEYVWRTVSGDFVDR